MKIVLITQEEPVYFTPFFKKLIDAKKEEIKLVIILGKRGPGNHPKGFYNSLKSLYALLLIFEPYGVIRNLLITLFSNKNGLACYTKKHKIPVLKIDDINHPATLIKLKELAPDVMINQSEILLKKELLAIPKIGTLNRHASLLPRFRGRLASFWGHKEEPPEYGTTIHFVDTEIDSGPIILQKKSDLDSTLSYTKILDLLFQEGADLMLQALDLIQNPNFVTIPNHYQGTKTYPFPSLKEAKAYRKTLKNRRVSSYHCKS